jgi:hypothetical protein
MEVYVSRKVPVQTLTVPASSSEEAHEIVGRLVRGGFARNSMEVEQRGPESFVVLLHTRSVNLARAQKAIEGTSLTDRLGRPSEAQLIMMGLGAAAIAGAALYAYLSARRSDDRFGELTRVERLARGITS